jgi:SAM-dependent methyltransferase
MTKSMHSMGESFGLTKELQYHVLRRIAPREPNICTGQAFAGRSKLELLGEHLDLAGKTVIDIGCGEGQECVEMALRGAKKVIGIDIRPELLDKAHESAKRNNVSEVCEFTERTLSKADLVISIDAFEHFDRPAEVLALMRSMLRSGGSVRVSFGPTWYHPLGGHLFSVFPWGHLVFSEQALIRWRSDFKDDGATRFNEVAGGLNQMTIRRFERLVQQSSLEPKWLECVPIRKLRWGHNRLTREFTTSIVRCELVPKDALSKNRSMVAGSMDQRVA